MIELDPSTPWEPPEASPPPRVPARRRWIALAAVGLITAGMLVAAVPRVSTEPVFTVDDFRVLSVQAGGGRLILGRLQPEGGGTQVEVLSLRDGTRLWSMALDVDQHLTFLTDNVMSLVTEVPTGPANTLTVLDAATGEQLWQRTQVVCFGRVAGRILVEDVAGVAEESPAVEVPPSGETSVNPALEQRGRRYLVLDERTGATVWEIRVPKGSAAEFSWVGDSAGPAFMSELSPTGLLQIRDLGTGAVIATHQLDWSGTISSLTIGDSFLESGAALPEQVLIAKAGERGTDVFDRGTGRLLWHWQAERSDARGGGHPYPCATDLLCVRDESGLTFIDPRTGERLWRVDRYNSVMGRDGDTVVANAWATPGNAELPIAAFDARTGRVVRKLEGWRFIETVPGGRLVMWKPVDVRRAVLSVVDPRSGRVVVFGKAEGWYGIPECHQQRNMLACLVNGALLVWKLP
ncbi:PQQ-like beta-propeller repeat protein [Dactylosporangium fulvum]|uniref:PQQ-like beta-propeller repeat protein n=1 Tax=Dactylosporangium fulvum TaxID=53359 RepID=A0ABY5W553_9ACTN|nr:PQQ-like beta-propeller repeat protein [Dactylosporangium fulvum]UWP85193.1 PQQ-like beta-propeller repeat protein [Dactylosporangium fulvum]